MPGTTRDRGPFQSGRHITQNLSTTMGSALLDQMDKEITCNQTQYGKKCGTSNSQAKLTLHMEGAEWIITMLWYISEQTYSACFPMPVLRTRFGRYSTLLVHLQKGEGSVD